MLFPCRSPAMPRICLPESDLSRPWQVYVRFMAQSRRQGDGMLTACWRLATPSSRKFVIRNIPISDAVASVKQSTLGEWQGSGRVVLGSRQGNGRRTEWERHGMCESVFKTAWEQHGNGMVCVNRPLKRHGTTWERHGMCESVYNTACERHGIGESALKVPIHVRVWLASPAGLEFQ
jgi:hypothetical protein